MKSWITSPNRYVKTVPGYYVSVIDGPRKALVEGPFATHAEALARVDVARMECNDPRGWFYAWGTARVRA